MSATSISALAADPILLEPSSSPSNASFQVAILSVGLVRTMLHPRVSESFRLLTSSLPDARSFFSLWDERASSLQPGLRDQYGAASAIWLRSSELACNTHCNLTDCANTNGKDSAFNFVRQATKWRVTRLQNSYATGCIAPHLVAFYEKCVAIACAWSASARDRQPLALRQRYCGTS